MSPRGLSNEDRSLAFVEVFPKELEIIRSARGKRQAPETALPLDKDLIGLAFSGGGIRSATFNLGVIQALAKYRLLHLVDYLSTVSGGGYIGSWLSSWAYYLALLPTANKNHIGLIEEILNRKPKNVGDLAEPPQIHFLRKYSNYLTPRLGILSGDTLAFVATYIRNLLLNQTILISLLMAILLIPQVLGLIFKQPIASWALWGVAIFGCAVLGFSLAKIVRNMTSETPDSSNSVILWVVVPLFIFSVLTSYVMWEIELEGLFYHFIKSYGLTGIILLGLGIAMSYSILWGFAASLTILDHSDLPYIRWEPMLWGLPSGVIGAGAVIVLFHIMHTWTMYGKMGAWYLITFGIPLVTLTVLMVGCFHIGLIGRAFPDALREWWARLGGEVLGMAVCWFLLALVACFVPIWLHKAVEYISNSEYHKTGSVLGGLGIGGGAAGWIGATLKGLRDAKSSQTGPAPTPGGQTNGSGSSKKTADIAARIAPPIFAVGLLIALAYGIYCLIPVERDLPLKGGGFGSVTVIAICFALLLISYLLGMRVDVNEFSLHNAYRNRIVRCYLGATHEGRRPQPFTGFDENDNIFLASLRDLGVPFHILNATLNVVKGKELALQARKARSFTFTPLYSGFDYTEEESVKNMPDSIELRDRTATNDPDVTKPGSYRLTENCSYNSLYRGARLGTAMAISGAAASPNMGHYTTGAVSFLLAIFSVRLGWWMGNPRKKIEWESGYPRSSWRCLLHELTGSTTDDRKEIYLSDGGHFDNLGVYELIRRRCRVIIACDAGADPSRGCGDLASVIEKCRVDFGTEVSIEELDDLCPKAITVFPGDVALQISKSPFALGTITYPDRSLGRLIYVKPSLNAQLPQDVLAYARLSSTFPHQSTLDQFFDEAQFESYRALGFACAEAAIHAIGDAIHS